MNRFNSNFGQYRDPKSNFSLIWITGGKRYIAVRNTSSLPKISLSSSGFPSWYSRGTADRLGFTYVNKIPYPIPIATPWREAILTVPCWSGWSFANSEETRQTGKCTPGEAPPSCKWSRNRERRIVASSISSTITGIEEFIIKNKQKSCMTSYSRGLLV